jgi:hypothetical protein
VDVPRSSRVITGVDDEGRVVRVLGFSGPLPEDDLRGRAGSRRPRPAPPTAKRI